MGAKLRIGRGVRETTITVNDRRRAAVRSHHEGLLVEASDEDSLAVALRVRLDIALVGGDTERPSTFSR